MEKPQDRLALSDLQGQEPGGVLEELGPQGSAADAAQAMEAEVAEFVENHSGATDEEGRHSVVRNGYLPERKLVTGIGPLKIRQPRVDDRGLLEEQRLHVVIESRLALGLAHHVLVPPEGQYT